MKILFAHNNFPGQFHRLAIALAEAGHEVTFLSHYTRSDIKVPGVRHIQVPLPEEEKSPNAPRKKYLSLLACGERFADALVSLKKEGYVPDVIHGHVGFGCLYYAPDIFPESAHAGYFEWYYTNKADTTFFAGNKPVELMTKAENRQSNMCVLSALKEATLGICPTNWQLSQHPPEYLHKLHVLHDGVDTDYFSPGQNPMDLHGFKAGDLELGDDAEIISYATRGLEPYRGFHTFYRALPQILKERPKAHAIIMADDKPSYGKKRPDGKSWKQVMQEEIEADPGRVHFLPFQPYPVYRELLRATSAHVYFTAPFVLSWSMLEAMSIACPLVASNTEPVQEVITHGRNGLLTDFWNADELAGHVIDMLGRRKELEPMRARARQTILNKYSLQKMLPRHIRLLEAAPGLKFASAEL